MSEKVNITVDLETLGRGDDAPIVQIAAIYFDQFGETIDSFEAFVHPDYLDPSGCDIKTIFWWMQQDKKVQDKVFGGGENRASLDVALNAFESWLNGCWSEGDDLRIWQHSSFDAPKIQYQFRKVLGREIDIPYWAWKDMRTLHALSGVEKPIGNGLHNAMNDCANQAKHISWSFNQLGVDLY